MFLHIAILKWGLENVILFFSVNVTTFTESGQTKRQNNKRCLVSMRSVMSTYNLAYSSTLNLPASGSTNQWGW